MVSKIKENFKEIKRKDGENISELQFQNRSVRFIEGLLSEWRNRYNINYYDTIKADRLVNLFDSLSGIDTDESWALRRKILEDKDPLLLMFSICGLQSLRSLEVIDYVKRSNNDYIGGVLEHYGIYGISKDKLIAHSLIGNNSNNAEELRRHFLVENSIDALLISLGGIDTPLSWEYRNSFKDISSYQKALILSLLGITGLRAWEMGMNLLYTGSTQSSTDYDSQFTFISTRTGDNSINAWNLRRQLIVIAINTHNPQLQKIYLDDIAQSLEGTKINASSEVKENEDKIRSMIVQRRMEEVLAISYGGLRQRYFWRRRQRLYNERINLSSIALGTYGGHAMVAYRKARSLRYNI